MKNIKVLGIDLANNVFQIHGYKGEMCVGKRLSRAKLMEFIAKLPRLYYWSKLAEDRITGRYVFKNTVTKSE